MNSNTKQQRRAYWLKTLHQWHWISSALCLLGMVLFSVTGITLNHASQIEAEPRVSSREAVLPPAVLAQLAGGTASTATPATARRPLPDALSAWLQQELSISAETAEAEWSPDEVYLSLPRPGGDAWVRIDRASGEVEYELTQRGWISYLNDLHKGRHTGLAWSWFIDLFAAACLIFSITGLFILKMHATQRPTTWPLVAFGLVLPLLLAILFIH